MNPTSEMRRVVLSSEQQAAEAGTQRQKLQIFPACPKRTLAKINISVVKRTETRTEAAAPEETLVTEANVDTGFASEATLITLVQYLIQASQDVPATPTTANAPLLLTAGLKFDRTTSETVSESAKSSAAHTEEVPSEEPALGPTPIFSIANEIQMDLLLANQQTIMAIQQ